MGCEPNVFKALKYGQCIFNSSAYVLNMPNMDMSFIPKKFFKTRKIGERETHNITWLDDEETI